MQKRWYAVPAVLAVAGVVLILTGQTPPAATQTLPPPAPASLSAIASSGSHPLTVTTTPSLNSTPRKTSSKLNRASGTPTWLTIPVIHVSESIIPYGLTNSELIPPPGQVIWYNHTPKPGQVGATVIAGHDQYGGPDVFWDLHKLKKGDVFTIRTSTGQRQCYRATQDAQKQDKVAAQNDASIWKPHTGKPDVVLMTCAVDAIVHGHSLFNWVVHSRRVAC